MIVDICLGVSVVLLSYGLYETRKENKRLSKLVANKVSWEDFSIEKTKINDDLTSRFGTHLRYYHSTEHVSTVNENIEVVKSRLNTTQQQVNAIQENINSLKPLLSFIRLKSIIKSKQDVLEDNNALVAALRKEVTALLK